jgi:hypothetical protein
MIIVNYFAKYSLEEQLGKEHWWKRKADTNDLLRSDPVNNSGLFTSESDFTQS